MINCVREIEWIFVCNSAVSVERRNKTERKFTSKFNILSSTVIEETHQNN